MDFCIVRLARFGVRGEEVRGEEEHLMKGYNGERIGVVVERRHGGVKGRKLIG